MNPIVTKLQTILNRLEIAYGPPAAAGLNDPLEMILYENVAYLVNDEAKEKAFTQLRDEIGISATSILAAPLDRLMQVVRPAAMAGKLAARLREIALITLEEFGGDLKDAVRQPLVQAKKSLMKFPSIGEPGAEKILLFANAYPVLALDSNGLRVLLRLGYGAEHKSYGATYRSVQLDAQTELDDDCTSNKRAYLLLRQHGKNTCKRSQPMCDRCSLADLCQYCANC